MSNYDLLNAVQPEEGWFAIVGIKDANVRQELVETREEADDVVEQFMAQKRNVFFGVAKYAGPDGRKKDNVLSLRSFWLDIDCGESKAAINEKTGIPGGYIDQVAALTALQEFCKLTGLRKPTIVNSGRGLHVYWTLSEDITREQWEPVAARLREVCFNHNLWADPAVFDVARILRIPGTLNFKDDPATPVTVTVQGKPQSLEEFSRCIGYRAKVVTEDKAPAVSRTSMLGQRFIANNENSFSKIMTRSAKGNGCQQLLSCYEERHELNEVRWFDALSVAKFCSDRDTAIHRMSEGYEGYDPDKTEQKVQHIVGPHTCEVFERNNPGGCDGCPFKGKIKSPITLGRKVIEADPEDNIVEAQTDDGELVTFHIPEYPFPFFRGKTGGVYLQPPKDEPEAEAKVVYPNDFYIVKRMRDPLLKDVAVFRDHSPNDGIKEFVIPIAKCAEAGELRKALADESIVCGKKQFELLAAYVLASVNSLRKKEKAELMRTQFGWADNDSVFILGDREITKDGVFHSPPSSTTAALARHFATVGTFEKWKEVFSMYNRPGLEPHAFAAGVAFGAPLFKFTGQLGAMLHVVHPLSGQGKTTILNMCNSVYGNPLGLSGTKEDTSNSKIMKMGILNNLPPTFDEMTNVEEKELSNLVYNVTQGKGKDRMKSSGNELRLNLTSWQTIALCTSNASFYAKLTSFKNSPDGELMRIIEYNIEYTNAIEPALAKQMFDHQLMENYGHAGVVYIQFLVNNLEYCKQLLAHTQAKIDNELQLQPKERFWSAKVASILTGLKIAKQLGLIDWDLKRIYKWATGMVLDLRQEVKPPATDVVSILGDYLNRNLNNTLIVNGNVDRRTNMHSLPIQEPKGGQLLIRYEPDTKKLFFAAKAFRKDCTNSQIDYNDLVKKLKAKGIYVRADTIRLSKGLQITSMNVHAIEFDCSNSEFIDMDVFVEAAKETEDAG